MNGSNVTGCLQLSTNNRYLNIERTGHYPSSATLPAICLPTFNTIIKTHTRQLDSPHVLLLHRHDTILLSLDLVSIYCTVFNTVLISSCYHWLLYCGIIENEHKKSHIAIAYIWEFISQNSSRCRSHKSRLSAVGRGWDLFEL